MSLAISLLAETQRSLAAATIAAAGAAYTGIGTSLADPSRVLFVQNLTDALLQFSLDGVNPHFPLPSNGFLLVDITANRTLPQGCFVAQGTRIYVTEIGTPTTGSVYVSTFYGSTR